MNSKTLIVKNTGILYIRMLLSLLISLFISRLILLNLGIADYGIYGVVSSVVTLFSFFNGAMTTSAQRCLAFDLGKNLEGNYSKSFGAIILISLAIAVCVVIMLEIFGASFIKNNLNIPNDRINAALIVFHAICISFFFSTIQVPFSSALIANEKINIFSIISIIDILLRLGVVISIRYLNGDKLVLYAVLLISVYFSTFLLYFVFANKIKKFSFKIEKIHLYVVFKYFGWNLIGGIVSTSLYQGLQIVLNIFFGPIINAAQTLTLQVKYSVDSFASNILVAVNPQIIKTSADSKFSEVLTLLRLSMRFSTLAILLISIPLFIKLDYVLILWLKTPPSYTEIFIRFYIIVAIIDVVSVPIVTLIQSIGDITKYQILYGIVMISVLPLSYLFYSYGFMPQTYGLILVFATVTVMFIRIYFLSRIIHVDIKVLLFDIFKQVIVLPSIVYVILSLLNRLFEDNLMGLFFIIILSTTIILILGWIVLFNAIERRIIMSFMNQRFKKYNI